MTRTKGSGGEDARAERLAAALRANLRRRKDQDRARKAARSDGAAPEDADPAAGRDDDASRD